MTQTARIQKNTGRKQKTLKYNVDLSLPIQDDLVVAKEFVDFLKTTIKVEGKKGNLGESISVSMNENKVNIVSKIPLRKRYLKYLTKKYLKKNDILDYLRVIASSKYTYIVTYVKVNDDEDKQE